MTVVLLLQPLRPPRTACAAPPLRRSAHTPSSSRPHPSFAPAHSLLRSGNTPPRPQSRHPHDLTTPTRTSRAARILVPPVGMSVPLTSCRRQGRRDIQNTSTSSTTGIFNSGISEDNFPDDRIIDGSIFFFFLLSFCFLFSFFFLR